MQEKFMRRAIALAVQGMNHNEGGPFGCVIVKDGKIIGEGNNKVTSTNDPTAHAEVVAIRNACKELNNFQLEGCEIYTSCEPCPMCLGAIYWARPDHIYFGCSRKDAAEIGFDDEFIYSELNLDLNQRSIKTEQVLKEESLIAFQTWMKKIDKTQY